MQSSHLQHVKKRRNGAIEEALNLFELVWSTWRTEEKKNQIKIQETKEQNQILERTFERTLTKQLKAIKSNGMEECSRAWIKEESN